MSWPENTVKLSDLLPTHRTGCDCLYQPGTADTLESAISNGYVREQTDGAVTIYNYTQSVQVEGMWTPVTRTCRGLIVDNATQTVLARPFPKFFNVGDQHADPIDPHAPVTVMDKMDGSLGIVYLHPLEGVKVATRGSVYSDQAKWATRWLRDHAPGWQPRPEVTFLVEIIYPENRIVLDYGDRAELVLLEVVNIATGQSVDPQRIVWPGGYVDVFDLTFDQAIERAAAGLGGDLVNAEGFVVRQDDRRVKLKYGEYVELHRLLFNFDNIRLWETQYIATACSLGVDPNVIARQAKASRDQVEAVAAQDDPVDAVIRRLPDRFADWARMLVNDWQAQTEDGQATLERFRLSLDGTEDRSAIAKRVINELAPSHDLPPGAFFAALDDKPGWQLAGLLAVRPDTRLRPVWAGADNPPDES